MSTLGITTFAQRIWLAGTLDAPVVIDVRTDNDFAEHNRALPGPVRRNLQLVASWEQWIAAAVRGVLRPTTP